MTRLVERLATITSDPPSQVRSFPHGSNLAKYGDRSLSADLRHGRTEARTKGECKNGFEVSRRDVPRILVGAAAP